MKNVVFAKLFWAVVFLLASLDAQSQVAINKVKKNKLVISYCNNNTITAYYFLPVSFFIPVRKNKIIIRLDRQKRNNDTLEFFLNDTTIQNSFGSGIFYDSLNKANKMYRYDYLKPSECNRFIFTIEKEKEIKYCKIFYNWGYTIEESKRTSFLLIKI